MEEEKVFCNVCKEYDVEEATDKWFYYCNGCSTSYCEDCRPRNDEYKSVYCKDCHNKDSNSTETSSIFSHDYDEEKVFCELCKKYINPMTEGYFDCAECEKNFCYSCKTEVQEYNFCSIKDCHYCRDGSCFNTFVLNKYCQECAPEEVLDEIDRREKEQEEFEEKYYRIQSTKGIRKKELVNALNEAGLVLRSDSKLCKKYIEHDYGNVEYIVERMCQMKYLYDYNDMKSMLDKVGDEYRETLDAGYFPDCGVFPEAEYRILQKIKQYPKIYPWQIEKFQNKAAITIQKGCENWLWKPVCKDGKPGIHVKLLMDHLKLNNQVSN